MYSPLDLPLRYSLFCSITEPRKIDVAKELTKIITKGVPSSREIRAPPNTVTYFCNRVTKTECTPSFDFCALILLDGTDRIYKMIESLRVRRVLI